MTYTEDFTSPDFDRALYLDNYDDTPSQLQVEAVALAEQEHIEEDPAYWAHYGYTEESFDPVSQGYYDDDPNPYHGDYAEDDGY